MSVPQLSIVSPVYRAAEIIEPLVRQITAAVAGLNLDYEIILVDDASPDEAWIRIAACSRQDPRVRGIRLSRNFGQHAALTAGLANARGRYVVVMDCDLQDDPAYIPALLAKAQEGYDIVLARKEARRHAWHRNLAARTFGAMSNALSGRKASDVHTGSYSLITRPVVDAFLRITDVHRHYLLILGWLGFSVGSIETEHRERHSGRSSYSFGRLLRHALEGLTSQSTLLLRISVALGFFYVIAAALGVAYLVVSYYLHGFRAGWASTIVLLLGSTGLILMAIGILGIYIGNIFDQVRGRPLYVVRDALNFSDGPQ